MPNKTKTRIEELQHSAEMRAALIAYFNRNDAAHISTASDIAAALHKDTKDVRYYLRALAESEQLVLAGKQGREYLFAKPGYSPAQAAIENAKAPAPAPKPKTAPAPAPREIELVVDGVVIVVGKNPETGRIRVTIEP